MILLISTGSFILGFIASRVVYGDQTLFYIKKANEILKKIEENAERKKTD